MKDPTVQTFREFLLGLGLDLDQDPELHRTPERFTELLRERFSGLHEDPPTMSTFALSSGDDPPGPVMLCALPFHSLCVHHLLPFFGTLDVAYLPGEKMVGFGSIGRVIEHFARRPQVQERMIAQIADYLQSSLQPRGLLIRLRARQLCMEMRGAEKTGELISIAHRGLLKEGPLRGELLQQFQRAEKPL